MKNRASVFFLLSAFMLGSCEKEHHSNNFNGYPPEVGEIILGKCATSGCHTDKSKDAANGLSLERWTSLFAGSRNSNTAVIPFRTDLSFLLYYLNTYADLGPTNEPVMPLFREALTRDEVLVIKNWVLAGAPARNGLLPFSDFAKREKLFVINQGCDNIYMLDAESGLVMRTIDVGVESRIESPHFMALSKDLEYFFVCFSNGKMFQKFRASDGMLAGQVDIGQGAWNTFALSEDGRIAFVIDWQANGRIAVVDADEMKLKLTYQGSGLLVNPHGSAVKGNYLYVTAQSGNFIYKIDIRDIFSPDINQVVLQPGETPNTAPRYDPHQIHFSPDGTEYSVSCQRSNEVRFFNASNDAYLGKVATGKYPQHPHYSESTDYMFVTNMEDDVSFPGTTGSVSIINYKTKTLVKNIFTGWQPHGNIVDDENKRVYILNRNLISTGPAPHHTSACGGRNGYISAIDMNTLDLVPGFKPEMSSDPYYGALSGHAH